jgi:hypothetical protein
MEIRRRLAGFDFTGLLVEELGWNRYRSTPLEILVDAVRYTLKSAGEKCGLVVYECSPGPNDQIPEYPLRRKIERQVARLTHEHLIVFVDAARKNQIWQWVRRQSGQPIRYRELPWRPGQTNESLVQILPGIAFELEEEERLTIVDVASRVQQQVNERVTKRFYDRFRDEHKAFLKFIEGIKEMADREWYASLMLNRLMFIYFIQKKGFLDNDRDYLRDRLRRMQQGFGEGHFHRFYRLFLLRLFHEGLGQPESDRSPELAALLGKVPYLNGGLFDVHDLERENPGIQIPDSAFEKIFEFFDAYHWHLDERPLRADNEINPDVLGYIFEKYINQKQMGAYYTREDITGYISRNTLVPFVLETARKHCPIAFAADGGVWRLLRNDPDRYIHEPLRKGVDLELPPEIAAGLTDTTQRTGWNRAAAEEFALPTETWREHVERRRHALELRRKLLAGEVTSIDELVTLNLDSERFALDVVAQSEGPELVRGFWSGLQHISVLDPTCGSGAFLFAALNILEGLYSACLDSMQGFVDDLERTERKHHPNALKPFRDALEQIARHPNRRYFILKSIVVGNLYGVDLMEEAVEICKLRLFLKLVAQLDSPDHIEPLPDIDFNIRAGNTLVGFTSLEEVRATQADRLGFAQDELTRIDEEAEVADRAFQQFRYQQTQQQLDARAFSDAKIELRRRLDGLRSELNGYLSGEYGVQADKAKALEEWKTKYQPFHWLTEFHGVMHAGGFDVIIGNPPYVELTKVSYNPRGFHTESAGNLYALCVERSLQVLKETGWLGMVLQQPVVSTVRMRVVRDLVSSRARVVLSSTYDDRPSKLFDGIHHSRIAILVANKQASQDHRLYVTSYEKWYKEERPTVFDRLTYIEFAQPQALSVFPKVGRPVEIRLIERLIRTPTLLGAWITSSATPHSLFYKITGVGHWFTITSRAPRFRRQGVAGSSTREASVCFPDASSRNRAFVILNSSLFYWFYQVRTNCRDFNPSDFKTFPVPASLNGENFDRLADRLQHALDESASFTRVNHKQTGEIEVEQFRPRFAKPIIDEIDRMLGAHYGFDEEELDFIINYDIKYRLGQDAEEAEGE